MKNFKLKFISMFLLTSFFGSFNYNAMEKTQSPVNSIKIELNKYNNYSDYEYEEEKVKSIELQELKECVGDEFKKLDFKIKEGHNCLKQAFHGENLDFINKSDILFEIIESFNKILNCFEKNALLIQYILQGIKSKQEFAAYSCSHNCIEITDLLKELTVKFKELVFFENNYINCLAIFFGSKNRNISQKIGTDKETLYKNGKNDNWTKAFDDLEFLKTNNYNLENFRFYRQLERLIEFYDLSQIEELYEYKYSTLSDFYVDRLRKYYEYKHIDLNKAPQMVRPFMLSIYKLFDFVMPNTNLIREGIINVISTYMSIKYKDKTKFFTYKFFTDKFFTDYEKEILFENIYTNLYDYGFLDTYVVCTNAFISLFDTVKSINLKEESKVTNEVLCACIQFLGNLLYNVMIPFNKSIRDENYTSKGFKTFIVDAVSLPSEEMDVFLKNNVSLNRLLYEIDNLNSKNYRLTFYDILNYVDKELCDKRFTKLVYKNKCSKNFIRYKLDIAYFRDALKKVKKGYFNENLIMDILNKDSRIFVILTDYIEEKKKIKEIEDNLLDLNK